MSSILFPEENIVNAMHEENNRMYNLIFILGWIPIVLTQSLVIFSLIYLMTLDEERLLTTRSSRFQMRFRVVYLKLSSIYKQYLIR